MTAADFANKSAGETKATIEKRYAATGDFSCGPDFFGQGALTVRDNIVATAAHINTSGSLVCPLTRVSISKCKFTLKVDGNLQDYDIDSVLGSGPKCDHPGQKIKPSQDWMVLKLKKHVSGAVQPYTVNDDPTLLTDQKGVVQVAKSTDWNPTNKKSVRDGERHYGRCNLQKVAGERTRPLSVETDCDTSGNSSGGSVLTPGTVPILLGVVSGTRDDCGSPQKKGPYTAGCWSSVMTPITGDFLALLKSQQESEPAFRPDPNQKSLKDL